MDILTCLSNVCSDDRDAQLAAVDYLSQIINSDISDCIIQLIENEKVVGIKEKLLLFLKQFFFPRMNTQLIERMFKSEDPFLRNAPMELLRYIDIDFVSEMSRLSVDPDKDVRKFVVDTLSEHSSKEVIHIVENLLNDGAAIVRQSAVESLGRMGAKNSANAIEELLYKEKKLMIQCTCLEALASLGFSPNSEDIILKFASENNPTFLFSFLRYLGVFGKTTDLNKLEEYLDKFGDFLLRPIAYAAFAIFQRNDKITLPDTLIKRFRNFINNPSDEDWVWEVARVLLFGLGDKGIVEARQILKTGQESIRFVAFEFLELYGDESDKQLVENQDTF
ncbi:MAG: HEAT repeat domain-containing protein [Desulfobacterales bacterium]|nr:HEAT repeat domain-containing protein [Desulfobacterales bacterium]